MNPTEKCPHCGAGIKNEYLRVLDPSIRWECLSTSEGCRTDLCREREKNQKLCKLLGEAKDWLHLLESEWDWEAKDPRERNQREYLRLYIKKITNQLSK